MHSLMTYLPEATSNTDSSQWTQSSDRSLYLVPIYVAVANVCTATIFCQGAQQITWAGNSSHLCPLLAPPEITLIEEMVDSI